MKATLNLDPAYIARRENIPVSALKKPDPVPAPAQMEPPMDGDAAQVMHLPVPPRVAEQ
jgi:hypothetical protein